MSILLADASVSAQVPVGVIVQKIVLGSEAARAGLVVGDIVSSWAQGDLIGSVNSPFDFWAVERERAPRGSVTLEGLHASKRVKWNLNSSIWGIEAGPNWEDAAAIHGHMRELVLQRRFAEIGDYCRTACVTVATPESSAWLLLEAGTWLNSSSKFQEADGFFGRALAITEKESKSLAAQFILERMGQAQMGRHDFAGAEKSFSEALARNRFVDAKSLATAYDQFELALVKYQQGLFSDSADYARQALSIRKVASPDSPDTEKTWNTLGACALQTGDLDSAEADFRKALELAIRLNPKSHETAFAYNNLGVLSLAQGNLTNAEDYFLRDVEITRSLNPNDYLLSYSWANLGAIALQRANLAGARQYFTKALAIQEERGNDSHVAKSLHNLGLVTAESDELVDAERLLRRASEIQDRVAPNTPDNAQTKDSLGSVLRREGKRDQATLLLKRALDLRTAINPNSLAVAETLYHIGQVHLDENELDQAQQRLQQAAALQKALAPDSYVYAETVAALARVTSLRHEPAATIQYYSDAIDVLDRQSAMLGGSGEGVSQFHKHYADYYRELVALLAHKGDVNRAFETLERSRAQTLLRMLAEGDVQLHTGAPKALVEKERRLNKQISDLAADRWRLMPVSQAAASQQKLIQSMADLLNERDQVRALMRSQNARYSALTEPQPVRLLEIQRQLDQNTLLLEYSLGRSSSYLFAVTQNSIACFEIASREKIDPAVNALYHNLSLRDQVREIIGRQEADVGARVLDPAIKLIERYRRLIVVADGALEYIPFGVLRVGGVPLLTDHEIVNCPSGSFLARMANMSQSARRYLYDAAILADPVFTRDDKRVIQRYNEQGRNDLHGKPDDYLRLPRLLESRKEALSIAKVFPPGRVFEAFDFDANSTTMSDRAIRGSRILHLATHGLFDTQNAQLSGLVFSLVDKNGNPETGFYGLANIFNADFQAQLVVLSGCETGLGQPVDGEGLIGVTWGFLYAGARTVVSSLWKVDEEATAELMAAFYEGMIQKRLAPARALRSAQILISRNPRWSDAFYWAGFRLEGEWRLHSVAR